MAHLRTELTSHARLVRNLYKACVRNFEDLYHHDFFESRYHIVKCRAEFDKNRDIADLEEARKVLKEGQKRLDDNMFYPPYEDPMAPGGMGENRELFHHDAVLDSWLPLEKARYPYYFHRREKRKKEYIERWVKTYGKPDYEDHDH